MEVRKRIILGDMHGMFGIVNDIYEKEQPDEVVLVGDYFDSFSISPECQKLAFEDLIELRKRHMQKHTGRFAMLLGNHDMHYLTNFIGQYSGYNKDTAWFAADLVSKYIDKEYLSFAYIDLINKTVYTHAGVTNTWLNKWCEGKLSFINSIEYKAFQFVGSDFFGNDVRNSPIWVRPQALAKDPYKDAEGDVWIQIFGHTHYPTVQITNVGNGKLYNIDCISKEYIVELHDTNWRLIDRYIEKT